MEEDDDFGDLYTDVLPSFTSSHSLPVLNGVSINNDHTENTNLTQLIGGGSNYHRRIELDEPARVLEIDSNGNLPNNQDLGFEDPNLVDESQIHVIEDDDNVDVGIGDSVSTGLSIPGVNGNGGVLGEDDSDWNSDSDSDGGLQIVLNDYNLGQIQDGEEVDEDANVLVVVDEAAERPRMEDNGYVGMLHGRFDVRDEDGERKELGDGPVNVNEVVQPSNNGFGYNNQFHSQFKVSDTVRAGNVCS